jgi:hypothetical protein
LINNNFYLFLFISFFFTQETFIDSTQIKNPSLSWKLSLVPGLGQIYNGNINKTFFINTVLGLSVVEMNINKNNINKRNTWAWWIFGIYTLGILDAYVDAHLTSFPIKKNSKIE